MATRGRGGVRAVSGPLGLTAAQAAVLTYVGDHFARHGCWPSYRDLMARFGWASTNAAAVHLRALRKKRALEQEGRPGQARAVVPAGVAPLLADVVRRHVAGLVNGTGGEKS